MPVVIGSLVSGVISYGHLCATSIHNVPLALGMSFRP
jgi:hypothetical protein